MQSGVSDLYLSVPVPSASLLYDSDCMALNSLNDSFFQATIISEDPTMDVETETTPEMEQRTGAARSCTTCSKAKAKCVRQQGQEICER